MILWEKKKKKRNEFMTKWTSGTSDPPSSIPIVFI